MTHYPDNRFGVIHRPLSVLASTNLSHYENDVSTFTCSKIMKGGQNYKSRLRDNTDQVPFGVIHHLLYSSGRRRFIKGKTTKRLALCIQQLVLY